MAGITPIVSGVTGFPTFDMSLPNSPLLTNIGAIRGINIHVKKYPNIEKPIAASNGWNWSLWKIKNAESTSPNALASDITKLSEFPTTRCTSFDAKNSIR